jgi:hypothetical protein
MIPESTTLFAELPRASILEIRLPAVDKCWACNVSFRVATSTKSGKIVMRVLLAFKDKHTTHMDSVHRTIRGYHSDAEVMVTKPESLPAEIERLEPDLIVCEETDPENLGQYQGAWIKLSIDPAQPTRFRVGQRRWESLNPGVEELMAVVADTQRLVDKPSG